LFFGQAFWKMLLVSIVFGHQTSFALIVAVNNINACATTYPPQIKIKTFNETKSLQKS